MMLLTGGDRKAAQRLWLRKVRIHMEAPQSSREQPLADSRTPAGEPAPARAQAVPKPETTAQLARRERSQIRLRQKHLASKIWASIRIASRRAMAACGDGRRRRRGGCGRSSRRSCRCGLAGSG